MKPAQKLTEENLQIILFVIVYSVAISISFILDFIKIDETINLILFFTIIISSNLLESRLIEYLDKVIHKLQNILK